MFDDNELHFAKTKRFNGLVIDEDSHAKDEYEKQGLKLFVDTWEPISDPRWMRLLMIRASGFGSFTVELKTNIPCYSPHVDIFTRFYRPRSRVSS